MIHSTIDYIDELLNCPKCKKNSNVKAKDETHPTRFRCNACQLNFNDESDATLLKPVAVVSTATTISLSVKRPSLFNLK